MSDDTEIPARVRAQRLHSGRCPTHGSMLENKGSFVPENSADNALHYTYACPEKGCKFDVVARVGSGLHKLWR